MLRMKLIHLLSCLLLVGVSPAGFAAEITVSAAASLTNAFKEMAQSYEVKYPQAKVLLNFGASGALLQQMAKGAPVDVFASADQETMDQAVKEGMIAPDAPHHFVRNMLVLVAPVDSKLGIKRREDLARPEIKRIAIGNPASVPAGRYARLALDAAKLWSGVESKAIPTQNVRQALDYVARGEVDAGFVYATDAAIMKDKVVSLFEVPLPVAIRYPIARVTASSHKEESTRFVAFVLSPEGQGILQKYGFGKP